VQHLKPCGGGLVSGKQVDMKDGDNEGDGLGAADGMVVVVGMPVQ
jgi:hypothetical protein